MKNQEFDLLNENFFTWTSQEKKIMILGSLFFYSLLILTFFIELLHFEYSLGFQKGFEGMGGINFLKSDSFFLIFTLSIIFFEYFLYISFYSLKGPKRRIFKEKNIQDLYYRRKKNCLRQKNIEIFFIIILIVYIFNVYIKIFFNFLFQIIIIELFIHFIFCFVLGTLFFPLIIVTLDIKVLKDSLFEELNKGNNLLKCKKIGEIFKTISIFSIILILGNLFLLIKVL